MVNCKYHFYYTEKNYTIFDSKRGTDLFSNENCRHFYENLSLSHTVTIENSNLCSTIFLRVCNGNIKIFET